MRFKTYAYIDFKADMKSYIQRETTVIFFLLNLSFKQGIDLLYAMVVFICTGPLELQGTQSKRALQK